MNQEELKSANESMYNQTPIIGGLIRTGSAIRLAEDNSLQALQFLAEALHKSTDQGVKDIAYKKLEAVSKQEEIDVICEIWLNRRGRKLTQLLKQKKWIALSSPELKVFTALNCNFLDLLEKDGEEIITPLVKALTDDDDTIAKNSNILLSNQRIMNLLCHKWEITRDTKLESIICQANYQATEPLQTKILTALKTENLTYILPIEQKEVIILSEYFFDSDQDIARNVYEVEKIINDQQNKCLFYFLTEQWQKYEQIDFDQNLLKIIFNNADLILRRKITEKIKISGKSDWLQIFLRRTKGKNIDFNLTAYDWEVTIDVLSKTNNDQEKWKLAQQAPPFYSQQLIKQIHSLNCVDSEKSYQQNLLYLGKKVTPNISDLKFWINDTSETLTFKDHSSDEIISLAISNERNLLVSSSRKKSGKYSYKGSIKLWELHSGKLLDTLSVSLGVSPFATELVISKQELLLNNDSNVIALRELHSGKLLNTLKSHADSITKLVINSEGTLLVSGSWDKSIKLWELPSGRLLKTLTGHTKYITELLINTEGNLLASASESEIKLWELPSGRLLHTLTGELGTSYCHLVMNREGTLLASSSWNTIQLWELPSGKLLDNIPTAHTHRISSLVMNRKGTLLVSGGSYIDLKKRLGPYDNIQLWELPSGVLLKTIDYDHNLRRPPWNSLVINRDGTLLASLSESYIKLWELPSGRLLQTLIGHTDRITNLVINKEENLLVSSSEDKTIKLWKLYSLHLLPVSKIVNYYDYIQDNLKRDDLNENQRNWLEFMLALVNNYRRFEIDIEDASIIAEAGEFDIDIEE